MRPRAWLLALAGTATLAAGPPGDLLAGRPGLLLAADLYSGEVLRRVDRRSRPGAVPAGSLLKPFLLLAWERAHPRRTPPRAYCAPGGPPGCWLRRGHGVLDVEAALAVSCNAYFRRLSGEVEEAVFQAVLRDFGLRAARGGLGDGFPEVETRLGRGSARRFLPQAMLEAYGGLWTGTRFRMDPARPAYRGTVDAGPRASAWLRAGLAASAREGTARGASDFVAGARIVGKTGTTARLGEGGAPLEAGTAAWFVGAVPADRPELGVLVFLEEGTGSTDAAPLGGELLAEVWAARRGAPTSVRTSRRR